MQENLPLAASYVNFDRSMLTSVADGASSSRRVRVYLRCRLGSEPVICLTILVISGVLSAAWDAVEFPKTRTKKTASQLGRSRQQRFCRGRAKRVEVMDQGNWESERKVITPHQQDEGAPGKIARLVGCNLPKG